MPRQTLKRCSYLAETKRKTGKTSKSRGGVACVDSMSRSKKSARRGAGARKMRIERIRKEIENGTYETEGKVRIAISRLIDDVLAKCGKGRR